MKKLLLTLCLLGVGKVFAAYECQLGLAQAADYDKLVAAVGLSTPGIEQTTNYLKEFHTEDTRGDRSTSIALSVHIDGWRGAEEINIEAFRRREARTGIETRTLGDKITLRGEGEETFFLEAYRLTVSCRLT